jgi:hypothetical protein
MNDLPRQKLHGIIVKYSRSICDDARRCEGLLRDLCSGYKRETHVLVSALRERVPHELLNTSSSGITKEVTIARLSKRLHDELAMTEEAARWAVESWALALGLMTATEISKLATKQPSGDSKAVSKQATPAPLPLPYNAPDPNQSPEIRGFRLGMSLSEALKQFNGLQALPADGIGQQRIKISVIGGGIFYEGANSSSGQKFSPGNDSYPVLKGLHSLELGLLDERIYSLSLEYDVSVKWNSLDDFAKQISASLGLTGVWRQIGPGDKRGLRTSSYWVEVDRGAWGPKLQLLDMQAERVIKERIASKEAHQRLTFNI